VPQKDKWPSEDPNDRAWFIFRKTIELGHEHGLNLLGTVLFDLGISVFTFYDMEIGTSAKFVVCLGDALFPPSAVLSANSGPMLRDFASKRTEAYEAHVETF